MAAPEVVLPWPEASTPTTVSALAGRLWVWAGAVNAALAWLFTRSQVDSDKVSELTATVNELEVAQDDSRAEVAQLKTKMAELEAQLTAVRDGPGALPVLAPRTPPEGVAADPATVATDLRAALRLPGEVKDLKITVDKDGKLNLESVAALY